MIEKICGRRRVLILNDHRRISPRVKNEIDVLSEEYDVHVLNWNRERTQDVPCKNEKLDWINLEAPKGSVKLALYLPILYWKIMRKLCNKKVDILHCTHLFLLPIVVLIGKVRSIRIVYDVYERHSIEISYYFSILSGIARKIIELLENFLVSKVDYILTVDSPSAFLERRYQKYNSNVQVLYNVPTLDTVISSQQVRRLRQKYKGQEIITYVGGLSRDKGVLRAIEMMKVVKEKVPNAKLLLIGLFQDSKKEAFDLIEELDLSKAVEIIGWIPYNEMMHYLQVTKVVIALHQPHKKFLFVSKGTGRKFFTYMGASLPIVSPRFGEVGAVVREEKCGILVDTVNPKEIAEAIVYLLEHPEEAKAMGERGRKAVEEKYNWETEKEKLLRAYKKLECEISEQKSRP